MMETLLDRIVGTVLSYTGATSKNELVINDGKAKEALRELLLERFATLLDGDNTEGDS